MYSTTMSRMIRAPRAAVFAALIDGQAVARWRTPDGMTGHVHEFDPRVGGRFRLSLTYDAPGQDGKSGARTDTYHGRFAELVPGERVVEVLEFESADEALRGEMTMTTTLIETRDGTEVHLRHDGVPDSVPLQDNEAGTRMALENLARYVEGWPTRSTCDSRAVSAT